MAVLVYCSTADATSALNTFATGAWGSRSKSFGNWKEVDEEGWLGKWYEGGAWLSCGWWGSFGGTKDHVWVGSVYSSRRDGAVIIHFSNLCFSRWKVGRCRQISHNYFTFKLRAYWHCPKNFLRKVSWESSFNSIHPNLRRSVGEVTLARISFCCTVSLKSKFLVRRLVSQRIFPWSRQSKWDYWGTCPFLTRSIYYFLTSDCWVGFFIFVIYVSCQKLLNHKWISPVLPMQHRGSPVHLSQTW